MWCFEQIFNTKSYPNLKSNGLIGSTIPSKKIISFVCKNEKLSSEESFSSIQIWGTKNIHTPNEINVFAIQNENTMVCDIHFSIEKCLAVSLYFVRIIFRLSFVTTAVRCWRFQSAYGNRIENYNKCAVCNGKVIDRIFVYGRVNNLLLTCYLPISCYYSLLVNFV